MNGERQKDPNEIGALWVKTSANGKEYMSGLINGEPVVCFRNTGKSGKQPDWRVLKSTPREMRQAASRHPEERRPSKVDDIDSDIPFY